VRRAVPTLLCVAGLILHGAGAGAETWWTVLNGKLIKGGVARPLSGTLTGSASSPGGEDPSPLLVTFDQFDLAAGKKDLLPRADIEYQGLHPVGYLTSVDQIQIEGDQVTLVHLRTGGKLLDPRPDRPGTVTFRFLELRADASHGGFVQGRLPEPDPDAPRRLVLKGDVYEVEQSFGLPTLTCSPSPVTPIPGGGAAAGGSVTVISYGSIDTASFGRREFVFVPASGGSILNRVRAPASTLSGRLEEGGAVVIANPAGATFTTSTVGEPVSAASAAQASASLTSNQVVLPMSVASAPTLEQLGIRAPDGAEISLNERGELLVESTGDLFVEGTLPEAPIPGLTSVTLYTRARIVVTGRIVLPGVSLRLDGGEVFAGGEIDAGNPAAQPPACQGLTPILPSAERLVGRFSLVASAARQIQIDVMPGDTRNRVLASVPRTPLAVAILGSRTLDVTDVDVDTLRLGAGEAEPLRPDLTAPSFPTSLPYRVTPAVMPVNRDRFSDLLALYPVQDAEIALGDRKLCLVAQTRDGELLEGCDRIDTSSGFPAAR
jgi:filamentous hemagglutinin family protein